MTRDDFSPYTLCIRRGHVERKAVPLNAKDSFDQSVLLDPMIECVASDQVGLKPKIIVVTGEIAKTGHPSEYEAAKLFFDKLCRQTGVPEKNLFIVPGNHNLNRGKTMGSLIIPVVLI